MVYLLKLGLSMVYIDLYPIYRTIFGLSIETGMIYGLKGIYLCFIYGIIYGIACGLSIETGIIYA